METRSGRKRWAIKWTKPVDRDALLALADEMESGPSGYTSRLWFIRAASRIREALGVEP